MAGQGRHKLAGAVGKKSEGGRRGRMKPRLLNRNALSCLSITSVHPCYLDASSVVRWTKMYTCDCFCVSLFWMCALLVELYAYRSKQARSFCCLLIGASLCRLIRSAWMHGLHAGLLWRKENKYLYFSSSHALCNTYVVCCSVLISTPTVLHEAVS